MCVWVCGDTGHVELISFPNSPSTANSIGRCTFRISLSSRIFGSIGRIISSESFHLESSHWIGDSMDGAQTEAVRRLVAVMCKVVKISTVQYSEMGVGRMGRRGLLHTARLNRCTLFLTCVVASGSVSGSGFLYSGTPARLLYVP